MGIDPIALLRSEADISPLRDFVTAFSALLADVGGEEEAVLIRGGQLLEALVTQDGWLPDIFAEPDPARYTQYLLHCDSAERFSVVSFVWGPGQETPVHDHRVWGLVGVLRGAEINQPYVRGASGELSPGGPAERLDAGTVVSLSPRHGDIHRVSNAYDDRTSVSIHVYGANIGAVRRATYGPDGSEKPFISGYANRLLPNLWDRSAARP